ncbi:hypothetical protein F511_22554 [Dorcoceras hygrometricum]|uniref:Uncharacterized protein n=1 Tax=Dorcoceras hygrometricum TaxID=472368 RepID=A0A2Z7D636_9LAMI|nr:hypothetical protein F511_22554 [Dorcoceras hygrometricum]
MLLRKFLEARHKNFQPGTPTTAIDLQILDMLLDAHLVDLEKLKAQMRAHNLEWQHPSQRLGFHSSEASGVRELSLSKQSGLQPTQVDVATAEREEVLTGGGCTEEEASSSDLDYWYSGRAYFRLQLSGYSDPRVRNNSFSFSLEPSNPDSSISASEYFRFGHSGYLSNWVKYVSYRVEDFRSEDIRFDSEAKVTDLVICVQKVYFRSELIRCDRLKFGYRIHQNTLRYYMLLFSNEYSDLADS